ncbi:Aspercryptin biosynthesis cluster-specific transcription regulator atnN [Madurella fahalii]|uniref:Aspercryptin biosynthesis cluster-specific transcription regulator atnN n=1 Tax=Madurella fahalii TaxID=1157608 RepID=A0ABQ0G8R4_9PEZI
MASLTRNPPAAASAVNGASEDAAQRPRRARTSKPKVKTGCNNCKQRRIKCDEKRPACANCIRSKKTCSGYPPPPRSARPFEEVKIAPKPLVAAGAPPPGRGSVHLPPKRVTKYKPHATPPLTPITPQAVMMMMMRHPSANLPFGDEEGQYFQLFREQTASELSGFFDSAFWTRSVLQECHSASPIRHAVVALGALYKTLEKSNESPPGSPFTERDPADNARRHWEMAFKQYSHALNALVRTDSGETISHRTRLMANVLLACFDSFVGDHRQAIVQIQTGLGLLERLRAERRRAFLAPPEEPVEEELTQMFTRLAIQAKSYDMAFHFPQPWVVRLTAPSNQGQDPSSPASDASSPISVSQNPIPDRFASVMEARVAWDKLCERIFRFTETMFAYAQNGVMGVLPTSLQHYGVSFKTDIEAWSQAFDHILASRTAPGVSSQEKAGIAVLKMFQIMGKILFMMTFSDSEMHFDNFTPLFQAIVDLALEVVGDEERRAAARRCPDPGFCRHRLPSQRHEPDIFGGHEYAARHIKPSFSADLGIVPPLYVVATKCRDPRIRRQAIQLLRSSARREGMWDSELTARIGMWIAEIEEEADEADDELDSSPNRYFGATRMPTPGASPVQAMSRPSTSTSANGGSPLASHLSDFGDSPLGPGGNAKGLSVAAAVGNGGAVAPRLQQRQQQKKVIPENKRVMVRAVEFDLRERSAVIQLGSRNLKTGTPDLKTRVTRITW